MTNAQDTGRNEGLHKTKDNNHNHNTDGAGAETAGALLSSSPEQSVSSDTPLSTRSQPPASIAMMEELTIRLQAAVRFNKITSLEDMLVAQSQTLDALFSRVLAQAIDAGSTDVVGVALALRAQKQCRRTVQALHRKNAQDKKARRDG